MTQVDNVPDCCAQNLPCCVSATNFYGEGSDGYWGAAGYFDDNFSIQYAAKMWENGGVPKNQLVVGLATYGRTQKLTTDQTSLGDPTKGAGWEGAYTLEAGFLSYFEILGGFPKNTWHFNEAGQFLWASDSKEFPLLNAISLAMQGKPMDVKSCAREGGTLTPDFTKVAPSVCAGTTKAPTKAGTTKAPTSAGTPSSSPSTGNSSGGGSGGNSPAANGSGGGGSGSGGGGNSGGGGSGSGGGGGNSG